MGAIYSLGTTASAVLMVWAGALTDRFRVRALGPVVLAGLAGARLFMALNPSAWALPLVVLCLRFFGQGMSSHLAVVGMARWFTASRGRALSIASLGFALGEAVLPLLFVALMVLVALMGAPALMWFLREERTPQSHAESHSSLGMDARHWTRGEALRHPLFWFMVPALPGPAAFNTAFFFHQVHVAQVKGLAHLELVALFPLYTGLAIAAMVGSGWALDRLGTPRLIPFFQLPMVVAFAVFATASGTGGLLVGLVFLALTTGANSTLPNAFLGRVLRHRAYRRDQGHGGGDHGARLGHRAGADRRADRRRDRHRGAVPGRGGILPADHAAHGRGRGPGAAPAGGVRGGRDGTASPA